MKTTNLIFPKAVEQSVIYGQDIRREHWKPGFSIVYDTSDDHRCRFYEAKSEDQYFFTKEDYLADDWEVVIPVRTMTLLEATNLLQDHGGIVQRQSTKVFMYLENQGKPHIGYPDQSGDFGLSLADIVADDWVEVERV